MLAVDISDKSLELARTRAQANGVEESVTFIHSDSSSILIEDGTVDSVLCAAILHHVDCQETARQINRILRPGGLAVFEEPLLGPAWLNRLKGLLPKRSDVSEDEQPLTMEQVDAVSRIVGRAGRRRVFMLSSRLYFRSPVRSFRVLKLMHQFDDWTLRHFPCTQSLASPLVWDATKE